MTGKKRVSTKKITGTVIDITSDMVCVLGSDYYIYRVKDKCYKELKSYGVGISNVVVMVLVPYNGNIIMAMPEELFVDSLHIPETIEVTDV